MSKWQKYKPQPRDLWRSTDPDSIVPLVPFIRGMTYAEPCYGAGDLEERLEGVSICKWRSDIEPQVSHVPKMDALNLKKEHLHDCALIITNPPYDFKMLQPLLDHLPTLKPTWLLLPADSCYNKRMAPYMRRATDIVSVRRLYFHTVGEDETQVKHAKQTSNYAWILFTNQNQFTRFHGRT